MEEISAILEQEPDKSVREILEEYTPTPYAAASKEKMAEFFTYNERGQLTGYTDGTTTASYTYGADGCRKSKTVKGKTTNHIWDGDQIVMESGDVFRVYYRGKKEIILGVTEGSLGMCTYMTDGHGSVTYLTDESGSIIMDYRYDAFGNQLREEIAVYNPIRYSGEYTDAETGMIYLRARYYDPTIGRFISEDPVKDGLNWYVYCNNDPVNNVDPLGLMIVAGNEARSYSIGSGNINNQLVDYESQDIAKLQQRLQELGYLDSAISDYGYFGVKTLDAVNQFKNDNNLYNLSAANGVVGATTWAYLGLDFDAVDTELGTITNIKIGKGYIGIDVTKNNFKQNLTLDNAEAVAKQVKQTYKVAYGEEFNVSTDSLYWEIVGHVFADQMAAAHRGGIMFDPLWARIQKSTSDFIDMGDDVIRRDFDRFLWDLMAKLSK